MKKWLIRLVCLYLFNVVVLLLVGWFEGSVTVGWAAWWAALVLTLATIWLKPLLARIFHGAASSIAQRARIGEKLVQYLATFVVQAVIWLLVVWLSDVAVRGWFWGYVLPPLYLLVAWVVYDLLDDRFERGATNLYDRTRARSRRKQP
ncbi:hypothetical protein N8K70_03440 [Microbacterium betulae]|uniref:Uncharacterized protein n=1 Tax=Microbacterium betulae TaxID=2981139 RepID=A0AA97I7R6_9MICO|nr:hypothetical protein [Microbacterium sp. AB]WOF23745.1 hypothetical protein N8K70_03440 [Microbacterium sp. AB]